MKTNRFLPVYLLAFIVGASLARAADDDTSGAANSSTSIDPDGPPPGFNAPPTPGPTSAQRTAALERRKKAEADRNWMLRGYADQLAKKKSTGKDDGTDSSSEFFRRADLDQASGLSLTDASEMDRLRDVQSDQDSLKSNDPNATQPPALPEAKKNSTSLFRPFLSSGRITAPQPFASPSPVFPPLTGPLKFDDSGSDQDDSPPHLAASVHPRVEDPGAMDIPGMTAMENNPATREESDLASSDLLPGEIVSQEKPHHALELELPLARNSERLQKMQTDALSVPGVPGQLSKKASVGPPVGLPPSSEAAPLVPQLSPLRPPLADPFDILR